jgi:hypothetical protein
VADALREVVGVKARNLDRHLRQHLVDNGHKSHLDNGWHAGHCLQLGRAIDAVDGRRFFSVPSKSPWWTLSMRLKPECASGAIAGAGVHVVQIRHGDRTQVFEARIVTCVSFLSTTVRSMIDALRRWAGPQPPDRHLLDLRQAHAALESRA